MRPRDIATCDAPNLCQRETPNADMTMRLSATTCPLKWTAKIVSGFRDFAYRSFWREDSFTPPTPDSRFCDGIGSRHVSLDRTVKVASGFLK
jgi:hypothetical protein